MNCPSVGRWRELVAHRLQPDVEPADWPPARAHLDECAVCRQEVLGLDPTLLFTALPRPIEDTASLAAMRDGVRALRRAAELRQVGRPRERRGADLQRVAAAALLVFGALYQAPRPAATPLARAATGAGAPGLMLEVQPAAYPAGMAAELAAAPWLENLNRPRARVYELGGGDLAVVMIVDKGLDL